MEKELLQKLRASRHAVSRIKYLLDRLQGDKEQFYAKKEQISKKIGGLIAKIKELRSGRDSLTAQVREKKEKRDKSHAAIKQESSRIDSLKAEMQKLMKSRSIRAFPLNLKQQIEELDFKMQTEGYTFEKERGVMKKIKDLQAQLQNSEDIEKIFAEIRSKWQKIRSLRKEANTLHSEMQALSVESQKLHEEMLAMSKQADILKPQRDDAAGRWSELKQQMIRLNLQLKEKLQETEHAKAEMDKLAIENIKSREAEVEEKIRKGGKLTTEDLLVFQDLIKRK